jgi:hypothetical protein
MRIACWSWEGRDHVGIVSPDGRALTPLACDDPSRGTLPLIDLPDCGGALPALRVSRLLLRVARLRAPLPSRRPGLPCVGRNDKSCVRARSASICHDAMAGDWSMVFTRYAGHVIGSFDSFFPMGPSIR